MATGSNWHERVFFGIHYDLHANGGDTNLGAELTADHLRETLQQVRPDWIQCDCKGHPGWTSWPTRVGSTSPGVVNDALRIHRDVCAELGIPLGMHYSGVIDQRAIELHPEWAAIDAAGQPSPQVTCPLSDYDRELMIPQLLELVSDYDVDGFWVDGENWGARPCYCARCRAEFTARTNLAEPPAGPEDEHWHTWLAFCRDLFVEHVTRYATAVHAAKPDCLVCSNWMYTVRQPEPIAAPVDYLSGDYAWSWGAERAAIEARVLDSRRMTWDLMAWGFTKTGPMNQPPCWEMKPAVHLCQELSEVVALGGAVMVYMKPQRSGWLVGWQHEILAEVADWCRERRDPCFGSTTLPEAAVLHDADHFYRHSGVLFNYGSGVDPVEGALHALLETQRSTDLILGDQLDRLGDYKLLVVPEQTGLSADRLAAIEDFAAAGGRVLMSGSHLADDCPALVGVAPGQLSEPPAVAGAWGQVQLAVDGIATGLSGDWQVPSPLGDTAVWGCRLAEQEPDKDHTSDPLITCRQVGAGSIVAVWGPLFRHYCQGHYPAVRRLVNSLVERLEVPWTVRCDGPAWLEVVARRQGDAILVNLLNRGAGETLSGRRVIIEELPPIGAVTVTVRIPRRPARVRLTPSAQTLDWTYADGQVTVHVPTVPIHEVLVIE